jgi:two-component system response regulator NreC
MRRIRILIADNHTLVREGLRALLKGHDDIEVIAEASTGLEAVDACVRLRPDVVLMDISMPSLDGLAATRRIVAANPAVHVLVLTVHDSVDYFFRALEAGALGFLVKDTASSALLTAVRAVAEGGVFLYPPLAQRLVEDYLQRVTSGDQGSTYVKLTHREREILVMIGAGHTNQEIAERLSLSINTVQTHRSHIIDKLDLHSRAELMRYAMRFGNAPATTHPDPGGDIPD